jgi:hypothetical protein
MAERFSEWLEAINYSPKTRVNYTRDGLRLHGELILKVAEILEVSANELLGLDTKAAPKKRGPQSQLEKQMAAIASLPRKEQQQLLAVVEAFISQHTAR